MQNTGQAISRLEVQMSQLAGSLTERPKGTLPSQPVKTLETLVMLIWLKWIK